MASAYWVMLSPPRLSSQLRATDTLRWEVVFFLYCLAGVGQVLSKKVFIAFWIKEKGLLPGNVNGRPQYPTGDM